MRGRIKGKKTTNEANSINRSSLFSPIFDLYQLKFCSYFENITRSRLIRTPNCFVGPHFHPRIKTMNHRIILFAALILVVLAVASVDQVVADECFPEGTICDETKPEQCCSGKCGDNNPKTRDQNICRA